MSRIFDILFSLVILFIFLPIGFIIIVILKLTGEGEVLYKQLRIGKNREEFGLYKFVTMLKDSPNLGAGDITLKNDSRVLPFGKFLRKTKLNEFPQFINVLLGHMSIVGPRPLVVNQFDLIPDQYKKKILFSSPGITSIGSIVFRDEEEFLNNYKDDSTKFYNEQIIPYKAKIECWYYDHRSIFMDLLIILITILSIVFPQIRFYNYLFNSLPKHPIFNSK